MRKSFITAICLCTVMLTSCIGPFTMTKRIYDWNQSLDSKWSREALFLLLSVFPVYDFVVLSDVLVFNSIDFWAGSPSSSSSAARSKFVSAGNKQAVMTLLPEQRRLRIDLFESYRPTAHFFIESQQDGTTVARNSKGGVFMSATTLKNGNVLIQSTKNQVQ